MDRKKLNELQKDIDAISDDLEELYASKDDAKKMELIASIKKKLALLAKKLPSKDTTLYSEKKILEAYQKLVEDLRDFQQEYEAKKMNQSKQDQPLEMQEIDPEEEYKKIELEAIREANKITEEMMKTQELINKKILEDSESIDNIYYDSEVAKDNSKKAVGELAKTSKVERDRRLRNFQIGSTVIGGFFGHVIGAIGGFLVSKGTSKVITHVHDKKLEKVQGAE
mgnify:CR=1 FL=1|jgi:hypothetical protein